MSLRRLALSSKTQSWSSSLSVWRWASVGLIDVLWGNQPFVEEHRWWWMMHLQDIYGSGETLFTPVIISRSVHTGLEESPARSRKWVWTITKLCMCDERGVRKDGEWTSRREIDDKDLSCFRRKQGRSIYLLLHHVVVDWISHGLASLHVQWSNRPWLSQVRDRRRRASWWVMCCTLLFVGLLHRLFCRTYVANRRERGGSWQTRWWSTSERPWWQEPTCCWVGSDLASAHVMCLELQVSVSAAASYLYSPSSITSAPCSFLVIAPAKAQDHVACLSLLLLLLLVLPLQMIPSLYLGVSRSPALRRNLLQADPSNVAAACYLYY